MPPRKKGAATAQTKSTRATGRAAPDTITTNRGKEIETTAAARRATRHVAAPDYNPKAVYAAPTATTAANTSRKRTKSATMQEDAPSKRGRGRPSKAATTTTKTAAISEPAKRGRGRPSKALRAGTAQKALKTAAKAPAAKSTAAAPTGKKRGRPSKADASADAEGPPQKRGRPSNASRAPAVVEDQTALPKKRGRPPKGGETTKIDTDDAAAAEQLGEELEDTAIDGEEGPSSKRKAPAATKGKGKVAKGKKTADDNNDAEEGREQTASGINYWLMKAEQDGHDVTVEDGSTINTAFTIDQLRAKTEPEPWDGVRNPTAAMNLRSMRAGDMAFFYASGGKQGRKPGITGIMEIVSGPEPDTTVNDPRSAGYVSKEADRKRWVQVRVEFRKKLSKPVHLTELQQFKNGELKDLQEFTAARLSVSKVSEEEWNFINGLIEGFDDDENDDDENASNLDSELEAQIAGPSGTTVVEEDTTTIVIEQPNGNVVIEEQVIEEQQLNLANGHALPAIVQTTEPDLPTTDSIFPDATSASERPASRAGSRRSSRAPSATGPKLGVNNSRPGSRAGSLAPPTGRGRSRTPGARGGSVGPLPGSVGPLPGTIEDPTGPLESVDETDEF